MPAHHHSSLTRELVSWLRGSHLGSLLSARQHATLNQLCQLVDARFSAHKKRSCIIIEVHHDHSKTRDFGIYGDSDLILPTGINFPTWIQNWIEDINSKQLWPAFPPRYGLEFDWVDDDYKLMGLFQNCDPSFCDADLLLDLLSIPGRNHVFLSSTITCIGMPAWIGLIKRWRECVKLVIPLQGIFAGALEIYIRKWFSQQFISVGLDPRSVAETLQLWSNANLIQLSVDCQLSADRPRPRLCLELLHKSPQSNYPSALQPLLEALHVPTEQLILCQQLHKEVPYVTKRPRFNLVESETLCLDLSHTKVAIDSHGVSIKDYLSLSLMTHPLNSSYA
jgi:hypothetical protein